PPRLRPHPPWRYIRPSLPPVPTSYRIGRWRAPDRPRPPGPLPRTGRGPARPVRRRSPAPPRIGAPECSRRRAPALGPEPPPPRARQRGLEARSSRSRRRQKSIEVFTDRERLAEERRALHRVHPSARPERSQPADVLAEPFPRVLERLAEMRPGPSGREHVACARELGEEVVLQRGRYRARRRVDQVDQPAPHGREAHRTRAVPRRVTSVADMVPVAVLLQRILDPRAVVDDVGDLVAVAVGGCLCQQVAL